MHLHILGYLGEGNAFPYIRVPHYMASNGSDMSVYILISGYSLISGYTETSWYSPISGFTPIIADCTSLGPRDEGWLAQDVSSRECIYISWGTLVYGNAFPYIRVPQYMASNGSYMSVYTPIPGYSLISGYNETDSAISGYTRIITDCISLGLDLGLQVLMFAF